MVKGLERFREHFREFSDRYVIIGGTACSLVLEQAALPFRSTRDIDIVLCVETLDRTFVNAFWEFIRLGKYHNKQKSTERPIFYRFYEPGDDAFPYMLELFSRTPDALPIRNNSHLTPIPVDEETSSLSAILLDSDYYSFLQSGRIELNDLPIVRPEYLIPLKAKAWLDLSAKRNAGAAIDEKDIRKHKNDVLKLYQVIDPSSSIFPPDQIKTDLRAFISALRADHSLNLKTLGLGTMNIKELFTTLERIYGLAN